jgi:hypothetical protein
MPFDIIQQLTLNQEKNDFVTKGQWKYYKLDATTNAKVIFRLLSLSGDVDLYIKQNSLFNPCNNNTAFGGDSLASNL